MSYSSRIVGAALAAILSLSTGVDLAASAESDGSLAGLSVLGANERDQAAVDWALGRYREADLELPPLVIAFHPDRQYCDGGAGVFRGNESPVRIDICVKNRYVVMHELAHAWDYHNLNDDTREAFMELQGLTVWSDHDVPWKDRGVEVLAETITWGLYDHDLVADSFESGEKAGAYQAITGKSPRRDRVVGVPIRHPEDPAEAAPGWDDAR